MTKPAILNEAIGDGWALYHGDTVDVARGLPDASIDFSVFSPPFASLYVYSDSPRDMGNVRNHAEFFENFGYLVAEQARVMKPGRLVAVHCMDLPTSKERDGWIGLKDFPGDIIRLYEREGFVYHSRVAIWKDPVTAMQRTKALGLLHKQIKKDSCMSRQGIADSLVVMRAPGANLEPVTHTNETFPVERWQRYASPVWATAERTDDEGFLVFTDEQRRDDPASGIDAGDTLQFRSAREHADERHICPLQLEVIRRAVRLWTNPGDVVWSPFAGIGSEGYVAIQEDRRFVGAELKASYFEAARRNLEEAANAAQMPLFAAAGAATQETV
jgi:hypothetical protein